MTKDKKERTNLLISLEVAKQILRKVCCPVAVLVLMAGPLTYPLECLADDQPVLKPDVPKLDTAPSVPGRAVPRGAVLKGNVEHHAKLSAPPKTKPKRLNSRIVRPDIGPLNGLLNGATDRDKNVSLGGELQQPYIIDRTIGVIGIKFLKLGERPPLVNRVFPGTPAYKMGLSVDDMIVAVDGVPTSGLTKDECYDLIVGTPNTAISVTLMHRGSFEVKNMVRMDFNEIPDPMVRRDYLHSL